MNQDLYLTRAPWYDEGLDYALKSWSCTFNRMGSKNLYKRIERIALGIVAEAAFEQYLKDYNIPYSTKGKTKWYEEDRYDIGIGDYATDVKSNFIDISIPKISRDIDKLFNKPDEWLKDCTALVPLDQFNPGDNEKRIHELKKKAFVFPFLYKQSDNPFDTNSEILIHAFWDYFWLKKGEMKDSKRVGKLHIYNNSNDTGSIRIYGTTELKDLVVDDIELKPKSTVISSRDYFQVFSAMWTGNNFPSGALSIRSGSTSNMVEEIDPDTICNFSSVKSGIVVNNWYPFALIPLNIHLAGWMTDSEFRLHGFKVPRFTHDIKQYTETQVDNWGVKIKDINRMQSIGKLGEL